MARIAVVGAGAIGGYVAAAAYQNGHQVQLCVRSPLSSLRVDVHGMKHRPAVRIVRRPEMADVADFVLLTTKAHDSTAAAVWFTRLCGPKTVVVVMQNGVDHVERIQPLVPDSVVVPALVHVAAERIAPGHIVHRAGRRVVLPAEAPADAAAEALAGDLIDVERVADFLTATWRKFLMNVAANPITALTGQRLGVLELPEVRDLARGILREAIAVGSACGAQLSEDDVAATLAEYTVLGPMTGTSMLADRLAGRPIEYELITASVVRCAARHNLPVPLNQAILALLRGNDLVATPQVLPAAGTRTRTLARAA